VINTQSQYIAMPPKISFSPLDPVIWISSFGFLRKNQNHLKNIFKGVFSILALGYLAMANPTFANSPRRQIPDRPSAKMLLTPTINNQINSQIDSRLLGQWELRGVFFIPISIILTPEGRGFMLSPSFAPGEDPQAIEFRYTVNNTQAPFQIDLEPIGEEPIRTIFDFTEDGRIRVELLGIQPGEERPTEFTTGALFLHRVSSLTRLPNNTQIANSPEAINKSREELASFTISMLLGYQESYFQENNRFTLNLRDLDMELTARNLRYYDYVTYLPENATDPLIITVTAKVPGLRSFIGVIFPIKYGDTEKFISGVCETIEPSTNPPSRPTLVNENVVCAAGSK
jgi:hypothetical protein